MRAFALLALLPSLTVALPSAHPLAELITRSAPAEAKAVLKSVTSSGSGCAKNSAAFLFRDDATIAFDAMVLDSTQTKRSVKCLITAELGLDPAWKFTVGRASTTRGYVDNEGGSYALKFVAGGKTVSVGGPVAPTKNGNWFVDDASEGVSSALGGGVTSFDVSLSITPVADKNTTITIDSLDLLFEYSK